MCSKQSHFLKKTSIVKPNFNFNFRDTLPFSQVEQTEKKSEAIRWTGGGSHIGIEPLQDQRLGIKERHKSLSCLNEMSSGGEAKDKDEISQQEETEAQEKPCVLTTPTILKFIITWISEVNVDGWGRCL